MHTYLICNQPLICTTWKFKLWLYKRLSLDFKNTQILEIIEIYIHLSIYTPTHTQHTHTRSHTHTHIYIHIYICIYIYIYIYICTYTYLCILIYFYIYIHMHTNTKKIVYCLVQHVWSWCKSNFFLLKKQKQRLDVQNTP